MPIPHELLVLRACELYGCTPDEAEQVDQERLINHLTLNALEGAVHQSRAAASKMSPGQLDLISDIRKMKRELEDDD